MDSDIYTVKSIGYSANLMHGVFDALLVQSNLLLCIADFSSLLMLFTNSKAIFLTVLIGGLIVHL